MGHGFHSKLFNLCFGTRILRSHHMENLDLVIIKKLGDIHIFLFVYQKLVIYPLVNQHSY